MTVEEIEQRVEGIREGARAGDAESAHYDEDELYKEVLETIAAGAEDADELARAALKTQELGLTRWYA